MKAASVLSSPNIAVESDGEKIYLTCLDPTNDAAHIDSIEIGKGNGSKYNMLFKVENLKLISGEYKIQISSKGISNFKHKTMNIQYWIATEAGSTFTKA